MTGRYKRFVMSDAKMSSTTQYRRSLQNGERERKRRRKTNRATEREQNAASSCGAPVQPDNICNVPELTAERAAESEQAISPTHGAYVRPVLASAENVYDESPELSEEGPREGNQSSAGGVCGDTGDVVTCTAENEAASEQAISPTHGAYVRPVLASAANVYDESPELSDIVTCRAENEAIGGILNSEPLGVEQLLDYQNLLYTDTVHVPYGATDASCSTNIKLPFTSAADTPLCPCTQSTVGDVQTMVLTLAIRYNLTWQLQCDILKMVNCIFGRDVIPASKYLYLKELDEAKVNFDVHVSCQTCGNYLGLRTGIAGCMLCDICKKDVSVSDPLNYFVSMPIDSQMKFFLENPSVAESMLTYRFDCQRVEKDSMEDIYDGAVYKTHSKPGGILQSKYNFSYNFFTDGCPFGKASSKTIWPIYVSFNELPPSLRSTYICMAGLYVGEKDPNLSVFLQPFVEQANKLSTTGFKWSYKGTDVVSKVIPLAAIADSVARCSLLNMQSFGAKYGCTFCLHESEHTARGQRFVITQTQYADRTLESLEEDLAKAYLVCAHPDASKRHSRGVKGPTPLLYLKYFNVTSGVVVDYMHNILLGVIRTHMEILFATEKKKFWVGMAEKKVGLAHLESAIDERLLKIKPPAFISRTPRSIKQRKLWKASDWLAWLLFYCLPCLIGILKDHQVIHLAMLSRATYLVLQNSVSEENVNEAHDLFLSYAYLVQKNFGECEMVYNMHLLQHIAQGVLNYGPLFTHNAFIFESQNRHLLQLCKSPNLLAIQVAKKFLIFNSFPSVASRLLSSAEAPSDFCTELLEKWAKYFTRLGDLVLLGRGKPCDTLSSEDVRCLTEFGMDPERSLSYKKCIYKNIRYICLKVYIKERRRKDAYLITKNKEIVVLKHIVQNSDMKVALCVEPLVLLGEIIKTKNPLMPKHKLIVSHVQETKGTESVKCIMPEEIAGPCVFIDTVFSKYICTVPYGAHTD